MSKRNHRKNFGKRETKPASDRFGKRIKKKVYDDSPKEKSKPERTRREK